MRGGKWWKNEGIHPAMENHGDMMRGKTKGWQTSSYDASLRIRWCGSISGLLHPWNISAGCFPHRKVVKITSTTLHLKTPNHDSCEKRQVSNALQSLQLCLWNTTWMSISNALPFKCNGSCPSKPSQSATRIHARPRSLGRSPSLCRCTWESAVVHVSTIRRESKDHGLNMVKSC